MPLRFLPNPEDTEPLFDGCVDTGDKTKPGTCPHRSHIKLCPRKAKAVTPSKKDHKRLGKKSWCCVELKTKNKTHVNLLSSFEDEAL